jgi:NAD(P)-dependent dehydrogenase (short-subunit alcohol dehydrogenase family)
MSEHTPGRPRLEGRTAVVVGGHSGFGRAIAERFASEGATVAIAGRRLGLVEEVAAGLGGTGHACDITDDDQVQALVAEVGDRHGRIHVAVNCAGFERATPIARLTPERLRAMHAVQLDGALFCMRHFGNAMAASGGGAFLSMSSLTAHAPSGGLAAYASAKAAVEYASKIAAVEYGPAKVRFNVIAASLIETPMTAQIFTVAPLIQAMVELTPLGRMGTSEDVSAAAAYLCSDDAAFVTGQTLCVDGGASLLALPTAQVLADVTRRWQEQQAGGGPS